MNGLHGTEALVVDGGDLADGHAIDAPRKKRGLSRDGPPDAAESGASHKRPRRRVDDDVHVHDPRREGLVTQLGRLGLSNAPCNSHGVAEPQLLTTRSPSDGTHAATRRSRSRFRSRSSSVSVSYTHLTLPTKA